ncbi:MAG TPA: YciI family protein [Devosia sp.]
MTKYILGFHGGGDMPTDPKVAEASMAKWVAWYQDMGKAVIDMGTPTIAKKTIGANGKVTDGGGANPLTGYSIIEANSLDEAVGMAKDCPIYAAGGSVEVAEMLPM